MNVMSHEGYLDMTDIYLTVCNFMQKIEDLILYGCPSRVFLAPTV